MGCSWQVRAGIVSGVEDPQWSRNFFLDGDERLDPEKFLRTGALARAWALYLETLCRDGLAVNWVKVEFVWL